MTVTIANRPIVGLETDVEFNPVTSCHHDAPQPYPNTQSVRQNFTEKIWCRYMNGRVLLWQFSWKTTPKFTGSSVSSEVKKSQILRQMVLTGSIFGEICIDDWYQWK